MVFTEYAAGSMGKRDTQTLLITRTFYSVLLYTTLCLRQMNVESLQQQQLLRCTVLMVMWKEDLVVYVSCRVCPLYNVTARENVELLS